MAKNFRTFRPWESLFVSGELKFQDKFQVDGKEPYASKRWFICAGQYPIIKSRKFGFYLGSICTIDCSAGLKEVLLWVWRKQNKKSNESWFSPSVLQRSRPLAHAVAQVTDTRNGNIQIYPMYDGKTETIGYSLGLIMLSNIFTVAKSALFIAGETPPVLFGQLNMDVSLDSMLKFWRCLSILLIIRAFGFPWS